MSGNGSLKTSDLALAVTLILRGYEYELRRGVEQRDGAFQRTCLWVFEHPEAHGIAIRYADGRARVEPNKFVRTWGVVRREMLDFLNA